MPLAKLGFGIMAYMDILWTLILVFGLFSVMLYPSLRYFNQGTGYSHVNPDLTAYESGTMGNLGYSSMQCGVMPIEVGRMSLQCPHGTIGEVYDFGLNLSDDTASNCANNDAISDCKPTSTSFLNHMESVSGAATYSFNFGTFGDLYTVNPTNTACNEALEDTRVFV